MDVDFNELAKHYSFLKQRNEQLEDEAVALKQRNKQLEDEAEARMSSETAIVICDGSEMCDKPPDILINNTRWKYPTPSQQMELAPWRNTHFSKYIDSIGCKYMLVRTSLVIDWFKGWFRDATNGEARRAAAGLSMEDVDALTTHHIIPQAAGGIDSIHNYFLVNGSVNSHFGNFITKECVAFVGEANFRVAQRAMQRFRELGVNGYTETKPDFDPYYVPPPMRAVKKRRIVAQYLVDDLRADDDDESAALVVGLEDFKLVIPELLQSEIERIEGVSPMQGRQQREVERSAKKAKEALLAAQEEAKRVAEAAAVHAPDAANDLRTMLQTAAIPTPTPPPRVPPRVTAARGDTSDGILGADVVSMLASNGNRCVLDHKNGEGEAAQRQQFLRFTTACAKAVRNDELKRAAFDQGQGSRASVVVFSLLGDYVILPVTNVRICARTNPFLIHYLISMELT